MENLWHCPLRPTSTCHRCGTAASLHVLKGLHNVQRCRSGAHVTTMASPLLRQDYWHCSVGRDATSYCHTEAPCVRRPTLRHHLVVSGTFHLQESSSDERRTFALPKGSRHPTGLRPSACDVPRGAENSPAAGNNSSPFGQQSIPYRRFVPRCRGFTPGQTARLRRAKYSVFGRIKTRMQRALQQAFRA